MRDFMRKFEWTFCILPYYNPIASSCRHFSELTQEADLADSTLSFIVPPQEIYWSLEVLKTSFVLVLLTSFSIVPNEGISFPDQMESPLERFLWIYAGWQELFFKDGLSAEKVSH